MQKRFNTMKNDRYPFISSILAVAVSCCMCPASLAEAYIGPGAGIAFFSSFLIFLVTFLLAFALFLFWPIRMVIARFRKRKIQQRLMRPGTVRTHRAIVIGLDGMDPELTKEFMQKGLLPNFCKLMEMGTFSPLRTTCPPISPVAWSSFSTGTNPARHGIYDFFTRDTNTYLPRLSSVYIGKPRRAINLGKYRIPLGKPDVRFLRRGISFWRLLGEADVTSSIIRVPVTFPPEKFTGRLLSAMCVPDLRGTQGSFTYYTTENGDPQAHTGGTRIFLKEESPGIFSSFIPGPENAFLKRPKETRLPFSLILAGEGGPVLEIKGEKFRIRQGAYTNWIKLPFSLGFGRKAYGIARFFPMSLDPDNIKLYCSPINIDPESPALPISSPLIYSVYLSRLIGPYATLGLAEDTWALNERVIDEDAFLKQCYLNHEEREQMFFSELTKLRRGVCCCVFDTTDRIQHMFWRYRDGEAHPAMKGFDPTTYAWVLEDLYKRMDAMVGKVLDMLDYNTLLMVISDHGFKSFQRGVNLNTWLHKNGYLAVKKGTSGKEEWLQGVDWARTRAFTLGLSGIFLNLKGREAQGIVSPGAEADALKTELITKLTGLKDKERGTRAITSVYDSTTVNHGPYSQDGPELIIGYGPGYRASWEAATGTVTDSVFTDNTRCWSGDHCIDSEHVPGVFFCSRPIDKEGPALIDIGPTILWEFGLKIPPYMEGKALFE
ncbi:MAG: alkaline phosphatase family protein [bacterium]